MKDTLLQKAEEFSNSEGISEGRLGIIVINHGSFFRRLRAGGDCTTAVYERFIKVFTDPAAWEAAKAADRERRKKSPPRAA